MQCLFHKAGIKKFHVISNQKLPMFIMLFICKLLGFQILMIKDPYMVINCCKRCESNFAGDTTFTNLL